MGILYKFKGLSLCTLIMIVCVYAHKDAVCLVGCAPWGEACARRRTGSGAPSCATLRVTRVEGGTAPHYAGNRAQLLVKVVC